MVMVQWVKAYPVDAHGSHDFRTVAAMLFSPR